MKGPSVHSAASYLSLSVENTLSHQAAHPVLAY